MIRQGGRNVLGGSALALAAATHDWTQHSGTIVADLTRTIVR